ncbi:pyridoxamine 5'-phosphate oxidase family protein [Nonomuraea sp. LP-02]|uniref:pyridoxamine 5'-phosphate oxidase family protein n=1 Tax=Nonomuraea sp. LP-02 TaxID=3097960 RepID=UPI002E362B8A|nr:pyridoxamine 5'-phosphate oxidase family protein [Nonomuraea sp. LP-02]MED7924163.1 pyridoxamine 5'-phosphate oxidase family protein [Nonomuraea sp. LP-02]
MASWQEFEQQAPELGKVARRLMEAYRHKVLATLRQDGSPRVSGTETTLKNGELWIGSMGGAVKALDLRRDPRMAIHVTSRAPEGDDPSSWEGDVKLAGRAIEITGADMLGAPEVPEVPEDGSHLFRIELTEVVWTHVEGDELVIDFWREGSSPHQARRH